MSDKYDPDYDSPEARADFAGSIQLSIRLMQNQINLDATSGR